MQTPFSKTYRLKVSRKNLIINAPNLPSPSLLLLPSPPPHTHSKKIQKIKTSTPFTLSYIATANNPLINWSQIVQAQTFTAFHSLIHQHTQTKYLHPKPWSMLFY